MGVTHILLIVLVSLPQLTGIIHIIYARSEVQISTTTKKTHTIDYNQGGRIPMWCMMLMFGVITVVKKIIIIQKHRLYIHGQLCKIEESTLIVKIGFE